MDDDCFFVKVVEMLARQTVSTGPVRSYGVDTFIDPEVLRSRALKFLEQRKLGVSEEKLGPDVNISRITKATRRTIWREDDGKLFC